MTQKMECPPFNLTTSVMVLGTILFVGVLLFTDMVYNNYKRTAISSFIITEKVSLSAGTYVALTSTENDQITILLNDHEGLTVGDTLWILK